MSYTAFISYRHSEHSRAHAIALEMALKRYAKPLLRPPLAIFRDEHVLQPGASLPKSIRAGLVASEFLIYLASREAAQSPWVADELRIWCEELGRTERLIVVHIQDTIVSTPDRMHIDWERSDALPPILREHVSGIPIWLDLTWAREPARRDLHHPEYRKVINALIARFRGVTPGEMSDTEVLTHRRNVRLRRAALSVMAILATATAIGGWRANANALALARTFAAAEVRGAQTALETGHPDEALAHLALALRTDPDNGLASDRALHLIASRQSPLLELLTDPDIDSPTSSLVEPPAKADKEEWLELHASPSAEYAVARSSTGTVKVWRIESSKPWTLRDRQIESLRVDNGHALALDRAGHMLHLDLAEKQVAELKGLPFAPSQFDLRGNGQWIAVSNADQVCVAERTQPPACAMIRADGKVSALQLSDDGSRLITLAQSVQVWTRENAQFIASAYHSPTEVVDAFFGPGESVCAVVHDPASLEDPSQSLVTCADVRDPASLEDPSQSPDTCAGACATDEPIIQNWSYDVVVRSHALPLGADYLLLGLSSDRVSLLRANSDKPVVIYVPGLAQTGTFDQGRAIFAQADGTLSLYDADSGRIRGVPVQLPPKTRPRIAAFDQGLLIMLADGRTYRLKGRAAAVAPSPVVPLGATAELPPWYRRTRGTASDGTRLVEAGRGLWTSEGPRGKGVTLKHEMDPQAGERLGEHEGFADTRASISADGRIALTAAANDALKVWDAHSGTPLARLANADDSLFVSELYLDPRGARALVVYFQELDLHCYGTGVQHYAMLDLRRDGTVRATPLAKGHNVFDADAQLRHAVVATSRDLWLLELDSGTLVPLRADFDSSIVRAAIDASGQRVAAATRDGGLYVFDVATRLAIVDRLIFDAKPEHNNGPPCDDDYRRNLGPLRFSPDGNAVGISVRYENEHEDLTLWSLVNVSYPLARTQTDRLADLVERLAGKRMAADGSLEPVPQLSVAEMRALAQQDPSKLTDLVAQLIATRGQWVDPQEFEPTHDAR